jgi:hypothetical protein
MAMAQDLRFYSAAADRDAIIVIDDGSIDCSMTVSQMATYNLFALQHSPDNRENNRDFFQSPNCAATKTSKRALHRRSRIITMELNGCSGLELTDAFTILEQQVHLASTTLKVNHLQS